MVKSPSLLRVVIIAVIAGTMLTACDRRTPDERFATAVQFYQQGDAASAEMEALKVVEKAPDDPAGVQASALLAQIYMQQNRLEEAQMQLKGALGKVSQLDPMGKEILKMYLGTLKSQKKFDEALTTIDQYQQEYADDPGTSISLRVARADTQVSAGQTTAARGVLSEIMDETTSPQEMALYRDLYLQSYLADENTTAAIDYLKEALPSAETPQQKLEIVTRISGIAASQENYPESRQYLQQTTDLMVDLMKDQHEMLALAASGMQLGQMYLVAGNLPGAKKVFTAIYNSPIEEPSAVQAIVNSLVETNLRLGDTSGTEKLLMSAAEKYPQGPFNQALERMREVIANGELQKVAPEDTSTLAMSYKADPQILWPEQLPQMLRAAASATSGTVTAETATTETTGTAAVVDETTGTQPVVEAEPTTATAAVSAAVAPEAAVVVSPGPETAYSAAKSSGTETDY